MKFNVPRISLPIRIRLTLWYTLLLAVTLVIFGGGFYSLLARSLLHQVDESLRTTADHLIASVAAENDPLFVLLSGHVRLPSIDIFSSANVYVQILHPDGRLVITSENLGSQRLPITEEMLHRVRRGESYFCTWDSGHGRLRLYVTPLMVGNRVVGVVEVGRGLQDVSTILRLTLSLMFLGGVGALLFASLTGMLLARQALAPIDRIAKAARSISQARDLSQRLEDIGQRDEIGRLVDIFNEMLERLENLFEAQKRLVADVSHELRTPLTTIQGHIDLLKRGAMEDPQLREEVIATIEAETRHLNRLLSDLTLLAQADAGVRLEMKPLELDSLLLDIYRYACLASKGVEVTIAHEDRAVVMGDPDRLRQLLINLVDNALKYTSPGGKVTLALYNEGEWVRVDVSDTGIGIPRDELPHIFERFYRGKKARGKRGTGLGLSIARWIAEAHGGHITVESEEGRGTTFSLWLRAMR